MPLPPAVSFLASSAGAGCLRLVERQCARSEEAARARCSLMPSAHHARVAAGLASMRLSAKLVARLLSQGFGWLLLLAVRCGFA